MPNRPSPRATVLALLIAILAWSAAAPASPVAAGRTAVAAPSAPAPAADPTHSPDPTASPAPTPSAPVPTPTAGPIGDAKPQPRAHGHTGSDARANGEALRPAPPGPPAGDPGEHLAQVRGRHPDRPRFAQNMMYRHTMTVYNRKGQLVKTISDRVTLARFGFPRWPSPVRGAPVEAAVAPDHKHIYVSQYSMYGPGFYHPGWDTGWVDDVIDRSFVYEISLSTLKKTRVFRVGPVPKAVAVSPNGKWLLVGNWTHRDVSVVSLKTGKQVRRIVVGGNPRGIAFAADSSKVYITAESGQRLMVYTFATRSLRTLIPLIPGQPRHLVIDPSGRYLYASLDQRGQVVKIDIERKKVVDRVSTGSHPRTIVLAPDGRSLYVVNYESRTLTKVRTRDMVVIQRLKTVGVHPVGVTYDNASRTVWVSCYRGTIERFADR